MISGKIADSSAWINFLHNVVSKETDAVVEAVKDNQLTLLPIIIQEVLQGIRNEKEFNSTKNAFLQLPFLQYDSVPMAVDAASLYRFLLKKGVTVRKPNDCLIAVICISSNFQLIHNDKDFENIAKYTSLKLYK